ncbi:MAG: colicin immunity domain-containing protein [Jatrophihabitans sp.]
MPGLRDALARYLDLLQPYVDRQITPREFQRQFLVRYLEADDEGPDEALEVLDAFFAEVDSYVDDPALRDPADRDLGPDELMAEAEQLLERAGLRP